MPLPAPLAAGLATVAVPDDIRAAAAEHLERWLTAPPFAAYGPAIEALVEAEAWEELVDAFYRVLPFGTGGRRGLVGVGPNRLNPWTVATSVQGHVHWLRAGGTGEVDPARPIHVVIAYDVRRFTDARGVFPEGIETPVHGLSSRDFAELAARVYAANGVHAHLLGRGSTRWVSTPELSFTIRHLDAQGGLNLSASHNPPDDNGVKVYDGRGGQLVPPHDQRLLDEVARIGDAESLTWDEAEASGFVHALPRGPHDAYVRAVADQAGPGTRALRVGYTPLHGTGCVHEILAAAGFDVLLHEAQATPDGAFPTVPGHVANPENPETMAHATDALDVDVVFGTDPDADRIGCEVLHDGAWVHLNGNDIAALVVFARLDGTHHERTPLVVQTEVTSQLVSRIARHHGAAVIDDLLVGFKYIGEVLRQLEEDGHYGSIEAANVTFLAGVEESHGVLTTAEMRDKDAAGGAIALAALADREKAQGRTLVDVLHDLQTAHGTVRCTQISARFEGATGASQMAALLDRLRSSPPVELAGRAVTAFFDHRDPEGRYGAIRSASDGASRNVLVFHLARRDSDDGARVVLRPSGTEPKVKLYVEYQGPRGLSAAAQADVEPFTAELARDARDALLG